MQGKKRRIPFFCLACRVFITFTVLIVFACSLYAQVSRQRQQECETLFSAAAAAERRNDPIEAELRYEECRDLAQKHHLPKVEAATLHRLAIIRARNKKFSESANLFRRALELDPRNALILCDFAQLHADRKDFDEAEIILKNALSIEPNNTKVLYSLGVVIATQRGERQAEGLRYLKLAVGEAGAYRELARIYRSKGDVSRAEFAEQRAKLADGARTSSGDLAVNAVNTETASIRPPQVETQKPQTPPEIVNRVRRELVEKEMREIAETQRNSTTPPVAHPPFIPAPVSPASPAKPSGIVTARPIETFPVLPPKPVAPVVAMAAPQSQIPQAHQATSLPVDPFVTTTQLQQSPVSPVRRLEPPTGETSPPPSLRTIPSTIPNRSEPNRSEPSSSMQSFQPSNLRTFASQPSTEGGATSIDLSELPPVKIASSTHPGQNFPQRIQVYAGSPGQETGSSVRVVPGNNERAERTATVNPLRRISADDGNPIDPGANTSLIAVLPSYSAIGVKRVPRTDQSVLSEQSDNVPSPAEQQPGRIVALRNIGESERTVIASDAVKPLPIRGVNVMQSPSAVSALRDTPKSVPAENTRLATNMRSPKPSVTETTGSEYARITPSEHRFSGATAPNVFSFASPRKEPPADNTRTLESAEIAVRPLQSGSPLPGTQPTHLPRITSGAVSSPRMEVANVAPSATPTPVVAPADPFPVMAEQPTFATVQRRELPLHALPAVESVEPHLVANTPPRLTETRPVSPPSPEPTKEIAARPIPKQEAPVKPFLVANTPPRLTETRPVTPPSPEPTKEVAAQPLPTQEIPVKPFLVANTPPRLTETRPVSPPSPEPTKEIAARPIPTQEAPAESFLVVNTPPKITETRPAPLPLPTPAREPAREVAARQVPTQETPVEPFLVASTPPKITETRSAPLPLTTPTREVAAKPILMQEVPVESFPVATHQPQLTEARLALPPLSETTSEIVAKPRLGREEAAGFATSRKAEQAIRVSENKDTAGFARSRR